MIQCAYLSKVEAPVQLDVAVVDAHGGVAEVWPCSGAGEGRGQNQQRVAARHCRSRLCGCCHKNGPFKQPVRVIPSLTSYPSEQCPPGSGRLPVQVMWLKVLHGHWPGV